MTDLVFDSSALLAYFLDAPGGNGVEEWLGRLSSDTQLKGWMTATSMGELYHLVMRRRNESQADRALKALQSLPITFVPVESELALAAARIKATHPVSYTDALAAALTIEVKGLLVAADPVFDSLRGLPFFSVQYL
jgi:predicted nucleic acid-binding protein